MQSSGSLFATIDWVVVVAGAIAISWISWPKIAGFFGSEVETVLHAQMAPVIGVLVTLVAGSVFARIAPSR